MQIEKGTTMDHGYILDTAPDWYTGIVHIGYVRRHILSVCKERGVDRASARNSSSS